MPTAPPDIMTIGRKVALCFGKNFTPKEAIRGHKLDIKKPVTRKTAATGMELPSKVLILNEITEIKVIAKRI